MRSNKIRSKKAIKEKDKEKYKKKNLIYKMQREQEEEKEVKNIKEWKIL